jgi:osmotically-inducible protein OsmY
MKQIITIIALALSLQGCIFVVGAAAGAAGIAVVYDHRKLKQIADDQEIANSIFDKIRANSQLTNSLSHIAVTCFNRVVLLTGQTVTPALRKQAEEIAHNTHGVKRVYNEVSVKGPSSSLTRASDSWITTKIKTQMLATQDLKSGSIKVITENGTVYLLGIVTRDQAETAVDIARQVSGVQKVVKMLQYRN